MLATLSLSGLARVYNVAIEDFQLPAAPVTKFSDKSKALVRVQRFADQYNFDLVADDAGFCRFVKRTETAADTAIREEMKQEMVEEVGAERVRAADEAINEDTNVAKTDTATGDKPAKAPRAKKTAADKPKNPNLARKVGVSRQPRPANEIQACRAGSNQALLVDVLVSGATIESAARHVNSETGKSLKDSVIYSTVLYDLCTVKGYGIRVEPMNGEQLYAKDLFVDADELKFGEKGAGEGYDAEKTRLVYFLVLADGMSGPVPHTARKTLTAEEKAAKPKRERKAKETTEAGADPKTPAATPEQVAEDADKARAEEQKAADAAAFEGDKPAA